VVCLRVKGRFTRRLSANAATCIFGRPIIGLNYLAGAASKGRTSRSRDSFASDTIDRIWSGTLFLCYLLNRKLRDGRVAGAYLVVYGFARFFIEILRGDPGRGQVFGSLLSGTQLISILLFAFGGLLWLRGSRRSTALGLLADGFSWPQIVMNRGGKDQRQHHGAEDSADNGDGQRF